MDIDSIMETIQAFREELPLFTSLIVALLGACIGSFLNVCIIRIPEGRSVVHPGSRCICGTPVKWYDNLPILGWIFLWGRARCCGAKLSIQYPLIELVTALLFVAFWLLREPGPAIAGWVLVSFMICVTVIDWKTMQIHDIFSVGAAVAGLILVTVFPEIHVVPSDDPWLLRATKSLVYGVIGLLVGAGLIFWLKTFAETILGREAMGEGDIVLVGAIAVYTGWEGAFFSLFGGAILGTVLIIPFMIAQKLMGGGKAEKQAETSPESADTENGGETNSEEGDEEESGALMGRAIPFGPMLAAAGILDFLYLHTEIDARFAEIREVIFGNLF